MSAAKAAFEPTRSQRNAINAQGGQITVSAAAGSGKTRVLVQRVIRLLTEKQIPADRLLILTFTNTAAAEMKSRISRAIDKLISEEPSNDFYRRQQLLLGSADICTIDSFCSSIVRENFFRLGISRDYRIGNETELHELRRRLMSDLIEKYYRKTLENGTTVETPFRTLSMLLTDTKLDTDLESQLLAAYDKYSAHAFPEKWIDMCISQYEPDADINDCISAKYLMKRLSSRVKKLRIIFDEASINRDDISIQYTLTKKKSYAAVMDAFDSYEFFLTELEELYSENELEVSSAAEIISGFSKVKISVGSSKDEQLKYTAAKLGEFASVVEKDMLEYGVFTQELYKEGNKKTLPVIKCLKEVLEEFDELFFAAKSEKGILDFHDLERLMLSMLYEKNSESGEYERSDFAKELSRRYYEIMIDEYQDTNDIQESIFKALSDNENNLFVVGDVKQSIYRFRDAQPKIFKSRCENSILYDEDSPQFPALIVLDRNFRSRSGIIDSVNHVFGLLMSEQAGEIEYDDTQRLSAGARYPERDDGEPDTEVHFISYNKSEDGEEDRLIENSNRAEAIYCAEMIRKMISDGIQVSDGETMRKADYGDFCILLRAVKNKAHIYSEELENAGIPACTDTQYDLLEKYEIRAAIAYLKILNNPLSDVDMAAALLCPVSGFTPDELAELKSEKGKRYYKKILRKSEDNDELGKKCASFLGLMRYFRTFAVTAPCDKLISEIFEKTGYMCAVRAMHDSAQRVQNLRRFISFAADYESSTSAGLTGFVRHIRYLEETDSGIKVNDTAPVNAVRIMTIHHSKGLEFPICILAGTNTSKTATSERINYHPKYGIGMRAMDDESFLCYNTLQYTAIKAANSNEEKSEQMRVLYVAMTRAKEKLIILSSFSSESEETEDGISNTFKKYLCETAKRCCLDENGRIASYEVMSCKNYSDWITMCLLVSDNMQELRELAEREFKGEIPEIAGSPEIKIVYGDNCRQGEQVKPAEKTVPSSDELLEELGEKFKAGKKVDVSTLIPSKVSASMLAHKGVAPEYVAVTRPSFARTERVSPTERGTATHEFLHYADFAALHDEISRTGEFENERQRIIELGMMTSQQSGLIIDNNIIGFVKTDLFDRMLKAIRLYREYRFTVNIPAKLAVVGEDISGTIQDDEMIAGETTVMQGAIDCIFEEEDGMIVVDYKTDRVKEASELAEKYGLQLRLYKEAAEKLFEKPVKQCYIFSLYNSEVIEV